MTTQRTCGNVLVAADFGYRHNTVPEDLVLGKDTITWNSTFKYLYIHFVNGKSIGVNTEPIRPNFFCRVILLLSLQWSLSPRATSTA